MEKLKSVEVVGSTFEAFGQGNLQKLLEAFSDDVIFVQHTTGCPASGTWIGTAKFAEAVKNDIAAFDILKFVPTYRLANDKQVFATVELELKVKKANSGVVHKLLISQYYTFDPILGKLKTFDEWFNSTAISKELQM